MTVLFKESRFTVEDYIMVQEVIYKAIERLDDDTVYALQTVRGIMMNQLYNDDKAEELNLAIDKQRIKRAEMRKL